MPHNRDIDSQQLPASNSSTSFHEHQRHAEPSSSTASGNNRLHEETHAEFLLSYLHRLYEEGRHTDVTILCDGVPVRHAHRIVLAAFSSSFETALSNANQGYVNLDINSQVTGISAADLTAVVEYMYTGRLKLYPRSIRNCLRNLACHSIVPLLDAFENSDDPNLEVEDCDHPNRLLIALDSFKAESRLADCVIRNRGMDIIKCHRTVLSAFSAVFERSLTRISPSSSAIVDLDAILPGMPIQQMTVIVDFMYSGRISAIRKRFPALQMAAALAQTRRLSTILSEEIELTKTHLQYFHLATGIRLQSPQDSETTEPLVAEDVQCICTADYSSIYSTFVKGPERRRKISSASQAPKGPRHAMPRLFSHGAALYEASEQNPENCELSSSGSETPFATVVLQPHARTYAHLKQDTSLPEVVTSMEVKIPLVVGDLEKMIEKPFKCPQCSHRTKDKSAIEKHVRSIHTNEAPYKCKHCSQAFKVQSNLVRHIRAHTGEKPYTCKECGMSYADKKNIDAHIFREHLKIQPIYCTQPKCRAKFWRVDSFFHHCRKMHGLEPNVIREPGQHNN
ncbi:Zinc fingerC2H2 type family protein [Aphelenchoides avenae]|nr:Zinc fingerC2H2 type family protein [Aphelenchus avenae]